MQKFLICFIILIVKVSSSFHSNKFISILKSKAKGVIASTLTAYCILPVNLIPSEITTFTSDSIVRRAVADDSTFTSDYFVRRVVADDSLDTKVAGNTLQDQLKAIQQEKVNSQKEMAEVIIIMIVSLLFFRNNNNFI